MTRPPLRSSLFPYTTLFRSPVRRFFKRLLYRLRPRLDEDDPAVILRLMLQELGPTFVKFGQLVASRVEVLPPNCDRKSTRLNSSHVKISYDVFCLKKKCDAK